MSEEITTTEGLAPVASFDEAVQRAMGEIDEATPIEEDSALPAEPNEPDAPQDDASEEPVGEVAEQLEDGTFDFDDTPEGSEESDDAPGMQYFQIEGIDEPVSLEELAKGYLRQSDYTRKTQELAELRKEAESSVKNVGEGAATLWESLRDDPVGTAAYLAVRAGLIDEKAVSARIKEVDGIRLVDETTLSNLVQERLDSAVQTDPRVQEAQAARIHQTIDRQFAAIEQDVGQPLSERARIKTLEFATQHGIADLRVAFAALRGQSKARDTESRKASTSPERPQPKPREDAGTREGEIVDFDEASRRALASLGIET